MLTFASDDATLQALEQQYGSADYIQSRELGLRDIFVKTVNEDQTDTLAEIESPTTIIYGGKDHDTPVEVGEKLAAGIPQSQLIVCPHYDHISILDRGRHQIALCIKEQLGVT